MQRPSRPSRLASGSILLASAALASCAAPTSDGGGVLVAIETDLTVPAALDTLQVELKDEAGTRFAQSYVLPKDAALPATLALDVGGNGTTTKGSLTPGAVAVGKTGSPLSVTVRGLLGGKVVVAREAQLALPADDRKLPIALASACLGKTCGAGSTCDAGQCVELAVDVTRLPVVR